MDKNKLPQFQKQLAERKEEIEKELKSLEKVPEMGDEVDSDIETQETQEFDNRLSVAQVLKTRLAELKSALWKIEEGKYGVCEKCKGEISDDILRLVPESRFCKSCKKSAKTNP